MAIERKLLEHKVYHHLVGQISNHQSGIERKLKPGTLAANLGVSRTTVRKAITRLIDEGLVLETPDGHCLVDKLESRTQQPVTDEFDHKSQIESTYWLIFDWILQGNSVGGENVIPRQFSELFSVSMGTVRHALDWLTQDGVLVRVPRRGWRFRSLTLPDVVDTIEIRTMFEAEVLRRSGSRIAPAALERLKTETEMLIEKIDTLSEQERRQADYKFHTTLVEQSTSAVLIDVVRPLIRRSMYVGLTCPPEKRHKVGSFREHLGILNELMNGNELSAIELLQAHLRRALQDTVAPLRDAIMFAGGSHVSHAAEPVSQ